MPIAIGAVCAPVYLFMLLKIDPRPGVKFFDRAREVDYVGMILTVGAFMSGVMAVNFGGVQYPWNSCRIIGLFVCSGVLFTLLALQQVFTVFTTTSRRIFPVEFFKKKTILILFAMTSAVGTAINLYDPHLLPVHAKRLGLRIRCAPPSLHLLDDLSHYQ